MLRCELIVQEIINHKSTIYKMYSLGRELIIQKRKSIPDIEVENFQFDEVRAKSRRDFTCSTRSRICSATSRSA